MEILGYRLGFDILKIGLMLLLISSCTNKMDNVISNKSFSAEKLQNEKVLFWGLSTGTLLQDKKEFLKLSNIALASLINKRENIDISADTILLRSLGEEKYTEIYQKHSFGETLSSEILLLISSAAEDYRYIVLSRIDKNEITDISNHSDKIISYTTKREMTIHTDIYDLQELELVWSGDNSNALSNTNSIQQHGSENFFKELIHTSVEKESYTTFPPPPTIEKMVKQSFKQLAASLPNTSCSELGYLICAK